MYYNKCTSLTSASSHITFSLHQAMLRKRLPHKKAQEASFYNTDFKVVDEV
jgi:hypothetical protein